MKETQITQEIIFSGIKLKEAVNKCECIRVGVEASRTTVYSGEGIKAAKERDKKADRKS